MLRLLRIIAEIVVVLVGVTVLLALLLIWRLSARPVTSEFMTPYIESGIESIVPDSQVKVEKTLLVWDNVDQSITMHADGIEVKDKNGRVIATMPALHARISATALLFGQFMPRALTVEHPQIRLERTADGQFVFGGLSMGGASDENAVASEEKDKTSILDAARTGFDALTSTLLMRRLQITNAVFDVYDDATQKTWSVGMPEISIRRTGLREVGKKLEFGALEGRIAVEVTQKDGIATLNVNYLYDPLAHEHQLTSDFADLTPSYLAGGHPETLGMGFASALDLPLGGKIAVTLDRALAFKTVAVDVQGGEGHLVYADFWDKPVAVKTLGLHGTYDRDQNKLSVSETRVDFGGPQLSLDVNGGKPTAPDKDMDFTAKVQFDKLPVNRFAELWPKPVLANPRDWLTQNLRDGTFNHAEVTLKGALAWNDPENFTLAEGGGKIALVNTRVSYLDGMPPVENVSGDATFDLDKMQVTINSGGIGAMRLKPFTLTISGLSAADQSIDIPLRVEGPVPDILRLIDHKPLGYAKALGIAPEDIQGKAEGTVAFNFPLLKALLMQDVKIKATVTTAGVSSSKLIKGLDLEQGELSLALDTAGMTAKGRMAINKIPFQVDWQENFNSAGAKFLRRATVTGAVRDGQWKQLGISAFEGSKGPSQLTFEMLKPDKKKIQYNATLDMTAAAIHVGLLGWSKPANSPAVLKFAAVARPGSAVEVNTLDLRGDKIRVNGTATLSPDMSSLQALNLPVFVLGRSNAALRVTQNAAGRGSLKVEASGAALDISGLGDDDTGADKAAQPDRRERSYRLNVDRLYTSDNGFIDKAQGRAVRDAEGWSEISLHGLADGAVPLSIELTPQADGTRKFSLTSDDFGRALKGAGITDTVKGGKLSVEGHSAPETPRQIEGEVKIGSFSVEHLPLLALLLNATSPFGFADILTDSTSFSRLEGHYRWAGDTLTLIKTHAAGSAMGINAEGKIDLDANEANLGGTLVPFSLVNKFINYIPIVGDLITGGEDQGVLAVAYQIKGPLSDLHVSVNPVSLLTPGFIRNLFFSDPVSED